MNQPTWFQLNQIHPWTGGVSPGLLPVRQEIIGLLCILLKRVCRSRFQRTHTHIQGSVSISYKAPLERDGHPLWWVNLLITAGSYLHQGHDTIRTQRISHTAFRRKVSGIFLHCLSHKENSGRLSQYKDNVRYIQAKGWSMQEEGHNL